MRLGSPSLGRSTYKTKVDELAFAEVWRGDQGFQKSCFSQIELGNRLTRLDMGERR